MVVGTGIGGANRRDDAVAAASDGKRSRTGRGGACPVDDGSPNNATGEHPHDHRPFLVALERERGEQLLAGFVEDQVPRLA